MSDIDMSKVRQHIRQYIEEAKDIENIPLKAVRKFVEKKMGVPKKSLHSLKSTVKKIVEEEVKEVAIQRSYNVVEQKIEKASKASKTEKKVEKKEKKASTKVEKKEEEVKVAAKADKKQKPKKVEKPVEERDDEETEDDDAEPKRPLTSYMLFCKEHREAIIKKYPELKILEVSVKLSEQWKELSEEERADYKKRSDETRALYNIQMKEWKERHPDAKTRAELKRERKARRAAPAKAPTARALFAKERRAELEESNPEMEAKEITAMIAKEWKEMDMERRVQYVKKAEELKGEEQTSEQEEQEEEEESKKVEKKKKPARALSPYNIFCKLDLGKVKEANPEATPKERMALFAAAWKTVSSEVLEECKRLSEEDKKKKMEEFLNAPEEETEEEEEVKKKEKKEKKERKLSAYNIYVREQSKLVKEANPSMTTPEVMREVSKMWKEEKEEVKEEYKEKAIAANEAAAAAKSTEGKEMEEEEEEPAKEKKSRKTSIPTSAFRLWVKENRKQILKNFPNLSREEANKLLKEKWTSLDKDVLIEYENRLHEMKVAKLREN